MKKSVSIILAIVSLLSLSACGKGDVGIKKTSKAPTDKKSNLTGITSFDDFIEKFNENFDVVKTETEDGNVIIEVNTPSAPSVDKIQDGSALKPAVPTVDKVTKPVIEETKKPEKEEGVLGKEETPEPTTPEKDEIKEEIKPSEPEKEPQKAPEKEEIKEEEKPSVSEKEEVTVETSKKEEEKIETPQVSKPMYTYTTGQKHTKLHYTKRYLYSILNSTQKEWYRKIDAAVNNLEEFAKLGADMSENNNYYIYYIYMADNPEHFYLGKNIMCRSNSSGDGGIYLTYAVSNVKGEYSGIMYSGMTEELKTKIRNKKAIFEKEAARILSTIPSNAPDVWKEKLIYDRILTDSHYNLSACWDGLANDNWTAYGILVNKYGVCESYSEAFQTLCLYAGINCAIVEGTAGGGHEWNCVEIDGEWYMCDITFDDPIGGGTGAAYHSYFNLTSEKMKELYHDWSYSRWPIPNCTVTKYSYHNYFS